VVHLTGIYQKGDVSEGEFNKNEYLVRQSLFEEMPLVMGLVDVVLCRGGLASISELLYLAKPSFLVPIPFSHQEENVRQVEDYFYILEEKNRGEWLEKISTGYPQFFHKVSYPERKSVDESLKKYYKQIQNLLDK
jgi:UDP-N-acetylglucosamine:LPS N-acetylglucosamine transferase